MKDLIKCLFFDNVYTFFFWVFLGMSFFTGEFVFFFLASVLMLADISESHYRKLIKEVRGE